MVTIGERIKYLREKEQLTQDELSKALGISRSTIASWESERRVPELGTAELLADFFNVSVDYLLGRTDTPHPLTSEELPETIAFSLPEGYNELTPEGQEKLREFLELIKLKYGKKGQ